MTTATTANDVLLFYPNLIGYSRVLFSLLSFLIMIGSPNNGGWLIAILLYIGSFIGDLFDGYVARKFNQCSTFGGLLDMITDRCSTLGLLYVLSIDIGSSLVVEQPSATTVALYRIIYLFLMLLDISSHWCQMYSQGQSKHHHKSDEGNQDRNILVQWFYKYYYFFGYLCVGAELTYITLYALNYMEQCVMQGEGVFFLSTAFVSATVMPIKTLFYLCLPGCIAKQAVNIMQLCSACYAVASYDADCCNNNNKKIEKKHNKES